MADRTEKKPPGKRISLDTVLRVTAPSDTSPSSLGDQDLAALIDGRLSGQQRDQVLSALDRDPAAYQAWLAASAAIEPKVRHRRNPGKRAFIPLLAAAAMLLVAVGLWMRMEPSLESRIDAGFEAIAASAKEATQAPPGYPVASRGAVDPAIEAAITGFRAGRGNLAGQRSRPADGRPQPIGYQFGRWLALIEAAAQATPPPLETFWADQLAIAQRLARTEPRDAASPGAQAIQGAVAMLEERLSASAERGSVEWRDALTDDVLLIRERLGVAAGRETL